MNVRMPNEQQVIKEALEILQQHMEPSKIAILLSILPIGESSYFEIREQIFSKETVDSLVEKVQAYQQKKREIERG